MKEIKIRMCVICKKRDKQDNLYRLQCKEKELIKFSGSGRSFYVCKKCVNSKKFLKYLLKNCNNKEKVLNFLKKEIS